MPEARQLSEADLIMAAMITAADLVRDQAFWKMHGSPLTNRLLDAKPKVEER